MGSITVSYLYEADNPYTILAHAIVGFYRPAEVLRILADDAYIATLILKETRSADIGGRFLDCVIEDILAHKKRMEYMHRLDELSSYFYQNLDKDRLRKEIRLALIEAGISIPDDYSTAGNVSSQDT